MRAPRASSGSSPVMRHVRLSTAFLYDLRCALAMENSAIVSVVFCDRDYIQFFRQFGTACVFLTLLRGGGGRR